MRPQPALSPLEKTKQLKEVDRPNRYNKLKTCPRRFPKTLLKHTTKRMTNRNNKRKTSLLAAKTTFRHWTD